MFDAHTLPNIVGQEILGDFNKLQKHEHFKNEASDLTKPIWQFVQQQIFDTQPQEFAPCQQSDLDVFDAQLSSLRHNQADEAIVTTLKTHLVKYINDKKSIMHAIVDPQVKTVMPCF